jgi:hypothetical protein
MSGGFPLTEMGYDSPMGLAIVTQAEMEAALKELLRQRARERTRRWMQYGLILVLLVENVYLVHLSHVWQDLAMRSEAVAARCVSLLKK